MAMTVSFAQEASRAEALLRDLTLRAAQQDPVSPLDEPEEKDAEMAWAWWRFLGSLAKTEGLEDIALEGLTPGLHRFKLDTPWVLDYLASHRADEARHGLMLFGYVKACYGDRPRKRTFSDVVIYGLGFRALKGLNRFDPRFVLLALFLYEKAAQEFYRQAIALAEPCGKGHLVTLLQSIQRDEARHLAGVTCLLKLIAAQYPAGPWRLKALSALGKFVLWDLDYGDDASHNVGLRRAFSTLGFEKTRFAGHMQESYLQALALMGVA
jgi:hypothetical protein